MAAPVRNWLFVLATAVLAACGAAPSTAPLTCAPIRANYVRTDSVYFPCDTLRDGTRGPKILAFLVDIYACNGTDVGQARAR